MATAATIGERTASSAGWLRTHLLPAAVVFLVFALHADWQAPAVNESHYLTKAKHYWNPEWAPHDFFLNSADSHEVFYLTVGWMAQWLELGAFAWTGRLLTWALLAAAFYRLCLAMQIGRWYAPLAAAIWVALNSRFNLAGEWVIGGFEAKGLSYAAVLWGLERWIAGRWNQSLIAFGAASAMHILVGGWSAIALGIAWLLLGRARPPLRSLWPGLLLASLLALPALISAISLNRGVDAATVDLANRIYVLLRLPHHLVPSQFGTGPALRMGALLVVWLLLGRRLPSDCEILRLRGFVNGSLVIAAVGGVLFLLTRGNDSLAASVLRYYWFRLADVAVPLGIAMLIPRWAITLGMVAQRSQRTVLVALLLAACVGLVDDAVRHWKASHPAPDSPRQVGDYAAWRDVCRWVSANTSPEAVFLTPRLSQTFKWYAGRAEVVNLKDIPQDAQHIVDWWQRLASVHRVLLPSGERKFLESLTQQPPDKLLELANRYNADYLLTDRQPELAFDRVYANNVYAVYRLPRR